MANLLTLIVSWLVSEICLLNGSLHRRNFKKAVDPAVLTVVRLLQEAVKAATWNQ